MCYKPCALIWACDSDSEWVGYDKILESILSFMDIHVIANAHQYAYTVIWVLLLLSRIWMLWGNSN